MGAAESLYLLQKWHISTEAGCGVGGEGDGSRVCVSGAWYTRFDDYGSVRVRCIGGRARPRHLGDRQIRSQSGRSVHIIHMHTSVRSAASDEMPSDLGRDGEESGSDGASVALVAPRLLAPSTQAPSSH